MYDPERTRDLSSEASAKRPLGVGECLVLVGLILLPGIGFAGLLILSTTSLRPHVRGLARAALLWHVLIWSALAATVLFLAVQLAMFLDKILSHLEPVR